jgi:hypothetical protein
VKQADHLRWHPDTLLQRREHHVLDLFLRTVLRKRVLIQRELIHEVVVALLIFARRMLALELPQRFDDHYYRVRPRVRQHVRRRLTPSPTVFVFPVANQLDESTAPISPDLLGMRFYMRVDDIIRSHGRINAVLTDE